MRTLLPYTSLIWLCPLLLLAGCSEKDHTLELADLTPGEHLYFERVITMERARTLALIYGETGVSLLDSLGVAWGDTLPPQIRDGLTNDPYRAKATAELLLHYVKAEQDSLKWAPEISRLGLPLPDLKRPVTERIPIPAEVPVKIEPET